jgi:tRNA modification GTPase
VRTDDTIAALASAPGRSPRAIVRLSGPQTDAVLATVLEPTGPAPPAACARFLLPGDTDPGTGRLRVPVGLLRFRAPRSYTGQDAAEILIPGNPHLARRVLAAVFDAGARQADPGEFTARAYLAGKMTIEQAEAVAHLIAAERDAELDAASLLLAGITGERYRAWADRLAALLALVEAGVDFTDQEDVVAIPPADLAAGLDELADAIAEHLGGAGAAESIEAVPRVAIVGRPNAGKSTLFNALIGKTRAIASDLPGTTRDVLAEPLDLSPDHAGAGAILLQDLPGLDLAPRTEADRAAQQAARQALAAADLLLACDPSGRFDLDDLPPDRPVLRVRTKADLADPAAATDGGLAVCALDGWRLAALRRAIADAALAPRASGATVPRHRAALAEALARIRDARSSVTPQRHALHSPELTADALRLALDALGSICGRITPDDVIGRVFASFCIGK